MVMLSAQPEASDPSHRKTETAATHRPVVACLVFLQPAALITSSPLPASFLTFPNYVKRYLFGFFWRAEVSLTVETSDLDVRSLV